MVAAVGCCISSGITLVIFFPRSIETEIAARDASRGARARSRSRSQHRAETPSTYASRIDTPAAYAHPLSGAASPSFGAGAAELARQGSAHTGTYLLTASPVTRPTRTLSYDDDELAKDAFALAPGPPEGSPPGYATKSVYLDPERDGGAFTQFVPALPLTRGRTTQPPSATTAGTGAGGTPATFYTPNRRRGDEEGGGVELGTVGKLTHRNLAKHEASRHSGVGRLLQNYSSPLGESWHSCDSHNVLTRRGLQDVAYASAMPRSHAR